MLRSKMEDMEGMEAPQTHHNTDINIASGLGHPSRFINYVRILDHIWTVLGFALLKGSFKSSFSHEKYQYTLDLFYYSPYSIQMLHLQMENPSFCFFFRGFVFLTKIIFKKMFGFQDYAMLEK